MTEQADIRQDPAFLQWKEGLKQQRLERMETEMEFSIRRITEWMKYIGVTSLSQLVERRKSHFSPNPPEHEGTAWEERKLHDFLHQLHNNGMKKGTVEKYWVVIHGFYKHNKVPLTDTYPEDLKRRASASS